jgi:hypothetical protein
LHDAGLPGLRQQSLADGSVDPNENFAGDRRDQVGGHSLPNHHSRILQDVLSGVAQYSQQHHRSNSIVLETVAVEDSDRSGQAGLQQPRRTYRKWNGNWKRGETAHAGREAGGKVFPALPPDEPPDPLGSCPI